MASSSGASTLLTNWITLATKQRYHLFDMSMQIDRRPAAKGAGNAHSSQWFWWSHSSNVRHFSCCSSFLIKVSYWSQPSRSFMDTVISGDILHFQLENHFRIFFRHWNQNQKETEGVRRLKRHFASWSLWGLKNQNIFSLLFVPCSNLVYYFLSFIQRQWVFLRC